MSGKNGFDTSDGTPATGTAGTKSGYESFDVPTSAQTPETTTSGGSGVDDNTATGGADDTPGNDTGSDKADANS